MKDLIVIGLIRVIAARWETAAYILGYDTPKINHIKDMNHGDPEYCCFELFRDWVEEYHDGNPKTWFTLLNTIGEDKAFTRSIEKVLKDLEKKYFG